MQTSNINTYSQGERINLLTEYLKRNFLILPISFSNFERKKKNEICKN